MGWTAYYQLLRDRPLDDSELATLAAFVDRTNTPVWDCESFGFRVTRATRTDQVVAYGFTKLPYDMEETTDHERLADALTALPTLITGLDVRIRDDFEMYGWDAQSRAVTMDRRRGPELVQFDDRDSFVELDDIVP